MYSDLQKFRPLLHSILVFLLQRGIGADIFRAMDVHLLEYHFTCWPPTFIGLTDQYVYAKELIENPQLYNIWSNREIRKN